MHAIQECAKWMPWLQFTILKHILNGKNESHRLSNYSYKQNTMQHTFIYYIIFIFLLLLFAIPLAVTNESENCGSQMDFCQVFSVLFL